MNRNPKLRCTTLVVNAMHTTDGQNPFARNRRSKMAPRMREVTGHVQLIVGPMFSGKSTELIRCMRRFQHAKLACLVVKSKLDNRYCDE